MIMNSCKKEEAKFDCITFIIPALNEEKHIGRVIDSIIRHCNNKLIKQIIIVDNGSTDKTKGIAAFKGSEILEKCNCSRKN